MSHSAWTPNLIIPGVAKCGTTTVYDLLAAHPQVTGGIDKEVRFLMDAGDDLATRANVRTQGLAGWAERFADRGRGAFTVWMDASPQYQYQRIALETIAALRDQPKVLFVVRQPARRLFSLYQYARYHQRTIPHIGSFAAFVDAIKHPVDPGIADQRMLANAWADTDYVQSIRRWRAVLPPGKLRIMRIEDLRSDRQETLRKLANWLAIDPAPLLAEQTVQSNETVVTRSRLVMKVGKGLAMALPENPVLRRLKDVVKGLNSGLIDHDELARNGALMTQLDAEFRPSWDALSELKADLENEAGGAAA